jgi:hypothetical protein
VLFRSPGDGNLEQWHPIPKVVPHADEARAVLVETRLEAEAEYAKAEGAGDPVGTTVWGRVSEHVRKLALRYAVSENHTQPETARRPSNGRGGSSLSPNTVRHSVHGARLMWPTTPVPTHEVPEDDAKLTEARPREVM